MAQPAVWVRAGRQHAVRVSSVLGEARQVSVEVGGAHLRVRRAAGQTNLIVDGEPVSVLPDGDVRVVDWRDCSYRLERGKPVRLEDARASSRPGESGGSLSAPMPGRIVKIAVQPGEQVAQNQPLVVLEAMKMEHVVEAPHAGIVATINVEDGEVVSAGALLLTLADLQ
jgi:biotin carboxyl carrier protein